MTEEKKITKETKTTKPSVKPANDKLSKLIEEIGKLSVLELADLVKALEEKFGVSAAAMVAPAAATAAPAAGQAAGEATSEQTTFNVVLADAGASKISVIKAVREINPNLGLKEAKDLVDTAPKEVASGVNKQTAEEAKKRLEAAGAKVELK